MNLRLSKLTRAASLSLIALGACGGEEPAGTTTGLATFTTTDGSETSGSDAATGEASEGGEGEAGSMGDGDTDSSSASSGDGDGDTSSAGDGDGDSSTSGDGDGDATTGDGDGDATTGDGDGDATTGDGDGDATTGDGDGDATTGDGDGDATSGDGDGDGDATTGDGDGDGDGTMVEPCSVQPPTVDFTPPQLIMVLDKSGSMFNGCFIDQAQNCIETFWEVLWNVLLDPSTGIITQRETQIKFGGILFPTVYQASGVITSDISCAVDPGLTVDPALGTASDFVTALPAATAAGSAYMVTPAQTGYDRVTEWMTSNPTTDRRAIVLFMDGAISDGLPVYDPGNPTPALEANCNAPSVPGAENTIPTLKANIEANHAAGIDTYVVGFVLNDLDTLAEMDELAVAGGVPVQGGAQSFYDASNSSNLLAAFDQIATDVATCDISVSVAPPFPDLVEVEVDGVAYDQIVPTPAGGICGPTDVGWFYTDATTLELRLCGATCDEFKAAPDDTDVNFFCVAG